MARFTERETEYMEQALKLARRALGKTSPNPMVGCVIVKRNKVIGKGYHKRAGRPHAEIEALKNCKESPKGATLYVTLEPCSHTGKTPPCVKDIKQAGIKEVIIAMQDPNPLVNGKGMRALRKAGIGCRSGLLKARAERLNEAFVCFHKNKRPFIIVKWAITLDGRMASVSGSSQWISGDSSRHYVHEIRSQVDGVMVGIGTVIHDNPLLNVRLENYAGRQPNRIIIDGFLRIPMRSKCLQLDSGSSAIILTTNLFQQERRVRSLQEFGHTVVECKGKRGIVDMEDAFKKLYEQGIQSVMVEGGSQIQTSLFADALFDKVICFVSPKIIGGGVTHNPLEGWAIEDMRRAVQLEDVKFRAYQDDLCIEGYTKR